MMTQKCCDRYKSIAIGVYISHSFIAPPYSSIGHTQRAYIYTVSRKNDTFIFWQLLYGKYGPLLMITLGDELQNAWSKNMPPRFT